jgi:SAM-dependent methyltransferase
MNKKLKPSRQPDTLIFEMYKTEKSLAEKLRAAAPEDREKLYKEVYNSYFETCRRIGYLPDSEKEKRSKMAQRALIRWAVRKRMRYLEIGAGDCVCAQEAASIGCFTVALDVVFPKPLANRPGVYRVVFDGSRIPFKAESFDFAFSNQCLEHQHPDDASDQTRDVARVLKYGAEYLCVTPHQYSGPHDISNGFDEQATGLHLHEYTLMELVNVMKLSGFSVKWCVAGARSAYCRVPFIFAWLMELFVSIFSHPARKIVADSLPVRSIIHIRMLGKKPPIDNG